MTATLSVQHNWSSIVATATTVCDVASRMRVASLGANDAGPNVACTTSGYGLPSWLGCAYSNLGNELCSDSRPTSWTISLTV